MFASRVQWDTKVQNGDDLVTVTLRKLSGHSLDKAREARGIAQATRIRAFGGDVMKHVRSEAVEDLAKELASRKENPAAMAEARYEEYDRETVLIAGIHRWAGKDAPLLSVQSIQDLEEDVAEKLKREILDKSLPPLTVQDAEAAQGKY